MAASESFPPGCQSFASPIRESTAGHDLIDWLEVARKVARSMSKAYASGIETDAGLGRSDYGANRMVPLDGLDGMEMA